MHDRFTAANQSLARIADVPGSWHILRVQAGYECIVADRLADRRFGIYCPQLDLWRPGRAVILDRRLALFSGYLFTFLWGLGDNLPRVKQCPGVHGFLCKPDGEPVLVSDRIIKQIQDAEFELYVAALPRAFFRRRKRHEQWTITTWRSPDHGFANPDPVARISALHQALGL
jgi:hypothetical protein